MKVSFKITTWEEVYVSDEDWPKIKEALEDGTVDSSNSLYGKFAASDYQVIPECEEQLTPEKNGGFATIEVEDGVNVIWTNSIIKE
jgi:hypothetical protein